MTETFTSMLALMAGGLLGVTFFGGLWWTVRKGMSSPSPAMWFFGSMMLRMSIALAGIWLVADGQWQRMLMCLLGFFLARLVVTWLTSPRRSTQPAGPEALHAP